MTKLTVVGAGAFLLGLFVGTRFSERDTATPLAEHRQIVAKYLEFERSPDGWQRDPQTGLQYRQNPYHLHPSLAALVDAGELRHLDVVLPKVLRSKEVNELWLRFVQSGRDVVYAEEGGHWPPEASSLGQPLHLNFWFRPEAKQSVDEFLRELSQIGE